MTTSTATQTRTVVTRSWRDIDPKVAIAAALTGVCDVVLVALFFAGAISAGELGIGVGPSSAGVLAAYLKRSAHVDVPALTRQAQTVIEAAAPLVEAIAPAATPAVEVAEDGLGVLEQALQTPTLPPV